MICELAGPTLLGAVRSNDVEPGMVDAYIHIHPDNYSSFITAIKTTLPSPEYIIVSCNCKEMTQCA